LHVRIDSRVAVAEAEAIHANLAGPKWLHIFEGMGHESFMSRREAEWKEEVQRFLNGLACD
jgi:hypothetical protein